ncbi:MAG: hypothetical protein NTX30_21665 [Deltaproteobacteria bacterium]|nr:hypothetical protein [Deltaproteobacteria bacterium]
MPEETIKKSMDDLLALSGEGLKRKLPGALIQIREYGIGNLLREYPDFLAKLLAALRKADPAGLFNQLPGAADQLMDLLWAGVSFRAEQVKEMKALLERAERPMHINIESSDSPFRGHFIVKEGKMNGRSGLLHFKDEDFRFMGPTEVLMDLLTGDLPMGFSNLRLQTAGHSGWVSRIAPVVREIVKLLKGTQEPAGKIGSGI